MIITLAKYLVLMLLSLGLLTPQVSGLLAATGLADGRVLVICTGDGLRALRISEAGEPVEVTQEAELCALVDATDTAGARRLPGRALHLLYVDDISLRHLLDVPVYARSLSHPRAPPVG